MSSNEGWELVPGQAILRTELHLRYGGRTQGGIGPSKRTRNVFVFSDPASGERHGYYDGWMPDSCFHYTGEGQYGDQRMLSGNASILNHRLEGRALRLFKGARDVVQYQGQFEVDPDEPWYETDAPESGGAAIRKVIVFRLRPLDTTPQPSQSKLVFASGEKASTVPVEEQWTEKAYVDPAREPYEAERREARLVLDFRDYLRRQGHVVNRIKILPAGEHKPIFTDLYDETRQLLVEAKGSCTRESVRMAIGQLADYSRFVPAEYRVILMPTRPRKDLLLLGASQGVAFIWPDAGKYISTDGSLLGAS